MEDVVAELTWRGLVHQATAADLGARLAAAPFAVYHGIDASADSLHVGNLLGVIVLKHLQAAGHRPIVLVGGGTTPIGDPSGKATERPMRTLEEVRANVAALREQLARFVDFDSAVPADRAVLVDNADWLGRLPLTDFLRDVGKHFTVNAMIAKESVRSRLEEREQGISFTEFSYMLLQAYDFLHLYDAHGCRLQIGGSDQWGNITAGVELVRKARGGAEVHGFTWPLLTKADGSKFGKSESGNVWLDPARTSPFQFFQFWVRQEDSEVIGLLRRFTFLPRDEIESVASAHAARPEARAAHRLLARTVTAMVHGADAAGAAEQASAALYGGDVVGLPATALLDVFSDAPSTTVAASRLGLPLIDLLGETGLVASRSAARREVEQGGIYVNNRRAEGADRPVAAGDLLDGGFVVLRRGKRTYHLVHFA